MPPHSVLWTGSIFWTMKMASWKTFGWMDAVVPFQIVVHQQTDPSRRTNRHVVLMNKELFRFCKNQRNYGHAIEATHSDYLVKYSAVRYGPLRLFRRWMREFLWVISLSAILMNEYIYFTGTHPSNMQNRGLKFSKIKLYLTKLSNKSFCDHHLLLNVNFC